MTVDHGPEYRHLGHISQNFQPVFRLLGLEQRAQLPQNHPQNIFLEPVNHKNIPVRHFFMFAANNI